MSDRRKRAGVTNKMVAYIAAALVHIAIAAALVFNFAWNKDVKTVEAFDAEKIDVVKASVIDDRDLEEEKNRIKERDRKKREQERLDQQRLDKLKKDAELQKQQIADLKEQQKLEKEKAAKLEKERKALALKPKKAAEAEEKRQAELERKQKKEAAEKRKRDAAERKRKEKERQQQEKEAADRKRLMEQIEAEERAAKQREADRRAAERTTTIVSQFFARIQEYVRVKRTIDPSFETWRKSVVEVKVSPSGQVRSVRTIESSGLARYDQSAEAAVYAASPVPMPDQSEYPDAVNKLLTFELVMKHPNAR